MIVASPIKTSKRLGMISARLIKNGPPGMIGASPIMTRRERRVSCMISVSHIDTEPPGSIGASLIKTGPPGMIGASPFITRKMSGMIRATLIKTGLPEMIGAIPIKTEKRPK